MSKVHFQAEGARGTSCGREAWRTSTVPGAVTCLDCQKTQGFVTAKAQADAKAEEAFWEQAPTTVKEPWKSGNLACSACGGEHFRYKGRACYGHYDVYVCANCNREVERLTETGMSF